MAVTHARKMSKIMKQYDFIRKDKKTTKQFSVSFLMWIEKILKTAHLVT